MKVPPKWAKTLSLAMALPMNIFAVGYLSMYFADQGMYSHGTGALILVTFTGLILGLMVYYAIRNKDRS